MISSPFLHVALLSLIGLGSGASAFAQSAPMIISRNGDKDAYDLKIKVRLDGKWTNFILDTGSDKSMVVASDRLRHYRALSSMVGQGAAGHQMHCDLIEVKSIVMGTFHKKRFPINRCEIDDDSGNLNGLGLDFVDQHVLTLNFKQSTVALTDKVADLPARLNFTPLKRLPTKHVVIPVAVANTGTLALLDTGAQMSAVDLKFVKAHPELFKKIPSDVPAKDAFGNIFDVQFFEAEELVVGDLVFHNVRLIAYPFRGDRSYLGPNVQMILGMNTLARANWVFDLIQDQWAVSQEGFGP